VDPDNRRDVDYKRLEEQLKRIASTKEPLLEDLKFFVTWKGLEVRIENPELFLKGEYIPIRCQGQEEERIIAFMRKRGKRTAYVIGARFFSKGSSFEKTVLTLPIGGVFTDIFTNRRLNLKKGRVSVDSLLKKYPFALLIN